MDFDLPVIWLIVILFSITMYVIMDGFDLGIGILFPFVQDKHDRDVMMNTVAPVWDGNETWLVLGGAGLMAAFPLAYAIVLSALYQPIILMLLGLIFRGVAFEFRFKAPEKEQHIWDKAFIGGSVMAAFFQGVILGAYINGIPVENKEFIGGELDWLTPFSIFTGIGVLIAYALLGSTWLIMKTEEQLQQRMLALTRPLIAMVVMALAIISIWTPLAHANIADRWFSLPNFYFLAIVPVLVAISIYSLMRELKSGYDMQPFISALIIVLLGLVGLTISIWPNIIPPSVSIWDAAAPTQSLVFALVGTLLIIPVILIYTVWSYRVFKGKVRHGDGYH
ncbi:cytochrome d ubiquinol oxidase subunit II [Methylobacillus gramineus]|uniref:cytochrome d ubiquinol oxidase subunit II n=1 Tax=Methylobacillus gramineus TaxID=755169 RepID=UPI001CFFA0C6|nr:cytochrome d ubiquinol oxidase subunit II [Methylobacillus gramineus]MCB5183919.1 cytochrome d ubiquinol oxidase subunit II [Methylobacillus gramineus]